MASVSLVDESHVTISPDLASIVAIFAHSICLPVIDVVCRDHFVRGSVLVEHGEESIAFVSRFAVHQFDQDWIVLIHGGKRVHDTRYTIHDIGLC